MEKHNEVENVAFQTSHCSVLQSFLCYVTWNRENAGDVDTEVHDRMSLVITDSLFRYQFTLLIVALHNVMVLIS